MTTPFLAPRADIHAGIRTANDDNNAPNQFAQGGGQPRRNRSLMRKYEVAAAAPDGTHHFSQHIAPATPVFESAFSAFARGSVIATVDGPCAIEDLLPGTLVITREGPPAPVMWIGSLTVLPAITAESPGLLKLTRIMADAFGLARPMPDLVTGPGARILRSPPRLRNLAAGHEMLTPVQYFNDGDTVFDITLSQPVSLFHLCLPHHAVIKVSGLDMETFHPGAGLLGGMGSNMKTLFMSLFPHLQREDEFGPMAYPHAGRALIDALTAA